MATQKKKNATLLRDQEKRNSDKAWKDLFSLREEITRRWSGPSAVDEVRRQREKKQ